MDGIFARNVHVKLKYKLLTWAKCLETFNKYKHSLFKIERTKCSLV